jgi:hypothetical protein
LGNVVFALVRTSEYRAASRDARLRQFVVAHDNVVQRCHTMRDAVSKERS